MKINYTIKQLCMLLLILSGTFSVGAQVTITGRVMDAEEPEGLISATILVVGTSVGTITDFDGNYTIDVPEGTTQLEFSYTGYESQTVDIGVQTVIDVTLSAGTILDEIVVVGYGVQRKSDLTGAISSVKADDIKALPNANVEQALQGKVAGVQVTPISGQPGSGAVIRIRGTGTLNDASPLYVVDGMILEGGIDFLNPNDVESIEVLKDASAAAIYGARGANGVVLITTKKGTFGQKTQFSVSSYRGIQGLANKIDLVNAEDYVTLVNEQRANDGESPLFPDTTASYGEGTDWQDEIYRNAAIYSLQVAARGATENMSFSISANYFNQEGIIPGSEFERLSFRANNEYKLMKNVTFGHNLALSFSKEKHEAGVTYDIYTVPNAFSVRDSVGDFTSIAEPIGAGANPSANIFYKRKPRRDLRTVGNIYLDIKLPFDLTFRSSLGADWNNKEEKDFNSVFVVDAKQQNPNSDLTVKNQRNENVLWENTLTYSKELGKHRINLLGGVTAQEYKYEELSGRTENLIGETEEFYYLDAGDITTRTSNNFSREWSMYSFLFRANYVFDNKYLFTGSLRRDGSSRFGKDNRYGVFPSLAVGWNIINESFMTDQNIFSRLKLRASWGKLGNDKINEYASQSTATSTLEYAYGEDEAVATGISLIDPGNPALKWEEAEHTNIGFEIGFFENRFKAEIDYFYQETNDILLRVPLPVYAGVNSDPFANAANVVNKGFDFNIGWQDQVGELGYDITIVASSVDNEVKELGGTQSEIPGGGGEGNNRTRTAKGLPIGSFYGYKVVGIFQNEEELASLPVLNNNQVVGDLRFEDIDGDGIITPDDRTLLGSPHPDFIFNLNLGLYYKGFDFAADFNGVTGNKVWNAKNQDRFPTANFETPFLDRWTGEGTSTEEPRLGTKTQNFVNSDRFLEDGSFIRLRSLGLGYTLPANLLDRLKLSKLRIYFQGTNLITWTAYSGYTPEITRSFDPENPTDQSVNIGIDSGVYPLNKVYTFGIELGF